MRLGWNPGDDLRSRWTPWTFRQPVATLNGWAHPLVEVHVAPPTSAELNELMREHYLNDTHDLPPYTGAVVPVSEQMQGMHS